MIILADTGVILRIFNASDPWHADANRATTALTNRSDQIVLSAQNIREFWNVCTRPVTARGGLGLSIAETNRRVAVLENLYVILEDSPLIYPRWRQIVLTLSVSGKQVHDANLVALMTAYGIDDILTFNGSDFSRFPGITAIDPRTV
jgi:predicted nucleic acid-binding protein